MTIRIFALGSCRVSRPIRHLEASGVATMTNRGDPFWYTHSSRAARQLTEIALGKAPFPVGLRPYIVETTPMDRTVEYDGRAAISNADAIVMEISTLNSTDMEGWALNSHLLWSAKRRGIEDPILDQCHKERIPDGDVLRDIEAVMEATGKPLLVVDHIFYRPVAGEPWRARTQITDLLEKEADRIGFSFLPTRSFLEHVPQETTLEDHDHYRKEFEPVVADAILRDLRQIVGSAGPGPANGV